MKKALILIGLLVVLALGVTTWLALSVGPETAPQDTKSIEIEIDAR